MLAAAARLALEEADDADSVDGDSVFSAGTGPVLSRQNSLGESRKSTPETGISRANSTDVSHVLH